MLGLGWELLAAAGLPRPDGTAHWAPPLRSGRQHVPAPSREKCRPVGNVGSAAGDARFGGRGCARFRCRAQLALGGRPAQVPRPIGAVPNATLNRSHQITTDVKALRFASAGMG